MFSGRYNYHTNNECISCMYYMYAALPQEHDRRHLPETRTFGHLFLDPLGAPSGLRSSSPGRAVQCSGRCCACEDVHL
jgi:hypothetical protein